MYRQALLGALLLVAGLAGTAHAQSAGHAPSEAESFVIGNSGSACEAQGVSMGAARGTVFDRKWVILCSDIGRPVGSAYSFRGAVDARAKAAPAREEGLDCGAPESADIPAAGNVAVTHCRGESSGLDWVIYTAASEKAVHLVEGFAGYDSALRLALASLVADAIVPGEVSIANLGPTDRLSIITARASVTDIETQIGQGYRGNNAGAYAEAAEIFAASADRLAKDAQDAQSLLARDHELKINQALQLSNLGAFEQAFRLFEEARRLSGGDPVQTRLARNYEAVDALNRGDLDGVIGILDRPVPTTAPAPRADAAGVSIGPYLAAGLNVSNSRTLSAVLDQETRLTPMERAAITDAQALQLRGIVLRIQGKNDEARETLTTAYGDAVRVRGGRVVSIARLRSQILSELALVHEAESRFGQAEALLRYALALVESQYPDSASVNLAKARLAGFLARRGQRQEALAQYREVVGAVTASGDSLVGMENVMRPYFDLLTEEGAAPELVTDLFTASQLIERPGAADTLAQLSRQLEAGDDEAANAFRRALTVTREIERGRIRLARLNALAETGAEIDALAEARARQQRLEAEKLQLLTTLSEYPEYRAVANRVVTSEDLQRSLGPGEAYLKLAQLAGSLYAVYVSPESIKGWRVSLGAQDVADYVAFLRETISVTVNGVQSTYPFEIDGAAELYEALLSPVTAELASVRHLIFEPDGAMLQLPITLLSGDRDGIAAYHARVEEGGDEFDFTGIDWLGRDRSVSTALSAASFRDARQTPASVAPRAYLGLGHNVPLGNVDETPGTRGAASGSSEPGCNWPAAAWNRPISAAELRSAAATFGRDRTTLLTDAAFTDLSIIGRTDLDSYRILHFATHGLVTPPAEGCPARPALLTSFAAGESDGLLSFKEIFDLNLDADLVVLSACDTASQASLEVTREAGVTSGGGQALDGLVRAFIAAGGRQVIASHWPAPDQFDATQRLFTDFYGGSGASLGDALRHAQVRLMDDPATSHPFYWAGFAIVGDAARAVPLR